MSGPSVGLFPKQLNAMGSLMDTVSPPGQRRAFYTRPPSHPQKWCIVVTSTYLEASTVITVSRAPAVEDLMLRDNIEFLHMPCFSFEAPSVGK